jgi:hypothetical protein
MPSESTEAETESNEATGRRERSAASGFHFAGAFAGLGLSKLALGFVWGASSTAAGVRRSHRFVRFLYKSLVGFEPTTLALGGLFRRS